MVLIKTGFSDAILFTSVIEKEMAIRLGKLIHDEFNTYASDIINREDAIRIINHLKDEFKL